MNFYLTDFTSLHPYALLYKCWGAQKHPDP